MSASLVGSEMCIRDSCGPPSSSTRPRTKAHRNMLRTPALHPRPGVGGITCLLYTSDAADDM
eukprot:8819204-Alexandrium_andersonii.AAC.1